MKKTLLAVCALLLALFCLVACPAGPSGPTTGGTQGNGNAPQFPQDGSKPTAGAWGFYAVAPDKTEKADYTELTEFADGKFSSGDAYLANQRASASATADVAFGYKAEKDGTVTLALDLLRRANDSAPEFAVYKNGTRIWPVSAATYEVPNVDRADILNVETAVKTGDVLFFRVSGGTLELIPTATYTADAYTEEKDLEKTRPDFSDARIDGIGATLESGSIAASGRTPSETAVEMTTADFIRALGREELDAGTTYRLTDGAELTLNISRGAYDCLDCTVITNGNVRITGGKNNEFENLTLVTGGSVMFEECNGVTFRHLEIVAEKGIAADIAFTCAELRFEDCRLIGDTYGMRDSSASSVIVDTYIAGNTAVETGGEYGSLFENCVILGEDTAVWAAGDSVTVWYSTLRGSVLLSGDKTVNGFVALNRFENLGGVVISDKTHNCVVLLNEVESVTASNSTNTYICSNLIFDRLSLADINYTIATRNEVVSGNVKTANLKNHNGDNITDMTARPDAGANVDLQPHVNKDAFINMERKSVVRTADGNTLPLDLYISEKAATNGRVVVAPGAYSCVNRITISNISDCTVYAYGVLMERYDIFEDVIFLNRTTRVSIRGLTEDMVINGCGTLVVVAKENGVVTYRAGAGGLQNHLDPKYFDYAATNSAYIGYRADSMIPYADVHLGAFRPFDEDTKLMYSTPDAVFYEMLEVGDVMTCRARGYNVVDIYDGTANHFEDVTILSGSVRCFWDYRAEEGTILDRVLVSPAPAKIIDEETYNEYLSLEEKYGVDFGVYIDEWGNFRGTPHHTVTADSTHTTYSRTGMKATSCVFENLSDDGTNHQGSHGRLAGYDPATGTITYKSNLASLGYTAVCYPFTAGDRVYVYTSDGRKICDTPALTSTASAGKADGYELYQIKVDPAAFKHEYLAGYNLGLSGAYDDKIMIDNRSRNGDGFVYDNVTAQNIRSRGFLVKSSGDIMKNCTLRNIGMAAIGLIFEPEWGESGVADAAQILNCYIENTGYFRNRTLYSPITIMGLGKNASSDEYLPYSNIVIKGNVIRNRATDYALYINSAINVDVSDNDFGTKIGETAETPYQSVFVDYAADIRFSGNTYTPYLAYIDEQIRFNGHRQIGGTDVNGAIEDDLRYQ